MSTSEPHLAFGPFRLDRANERVLAHGRTVSLTPKSFAVLQYLASRPQRLVTKRQLLTDVWKDVIVGDASVKVCIREIRAALGDDIKQPKYIETVHRRGYRFVGDATELSVVSDPAAPAIASQPAFSEPSATRHDIVGRDRELEGLNAALERASAGQRQCLFLAGGAGAGKTALIQAFAEQNAGRALFMEGHAFEQFGVAEPYMPVWEALTRLPDELAAPLEALLARHAAVREDPDAEAGRVSEPRASTNRLLRELLDGIERLTINQTVVLILEDLHWSDYSTLDLVTALARRRSTARLLLIVTYRPESLVDGHPLRTVAHGLAAASLSTEIPLGLLDQCGVDAFLRARFAGNTFPPDLARRLFHRTNGHPLFLVHLVGDLIAHHTLVHQPSGQWELVNPTAPLLETEVPWTVRAMIEGDFERLEDDAREALEAAAVAGQEFSAAAVAEILGQDVVRAEDACDDLARKHRFLERRGVVEWPDGTVAGRYRFIHEMYHGVVYQRVPPARRVRMHHTLGLRLEQSWGDRAVEEAAVLATHFESGHDWVRAVKYLLHSANAATRHYAHRESIQSLRRAMTAVNHLPPAERERDELDVLMGLAVNLRVTEGCAAPEVREIHARAYELCRRLEREGNLSRTFPILWGIWVFHKVRSDLEQARVMAAELLAMARAANDAALELQARQAVSVTALCLGQPQVSLEQMQHVAGIYDPQRHAVNTERFGQDPAVAIQSFGAIALALLGRADEARAASAHAIQLATKLNQPSSIALATHFSGMLAQLMGEAVAAAHWAQETIALSAVEGFSFWHAGSTIILGWARTVLGGPDASDGIEQIRAGLDAWAATGSRTYRTYYLGLLADALLRLDRPTEALAAADAALHSVTELSEHLFERQLQKLRSDCLSALTVD